MSAAGAPVVGRAGRAAADARAAFGAALASALEAARTVKLAAATPAVHRHLRAVDGGRVRAVSASTGCRPCSTASRSSSCSAGW